MHLLFPSDPFDRSLADENYAEECAAFRVRGCAASLFSFEEFELGDFKAKPALPEGALVLYRGWMLTPEKYGRLEKALASRGAVLS